MPDVGHPSKLDADAELNKTNIRKDADISRAYLRIELILSAVFLQERLRGQPAEIVERGAQPDMVPVPPG
ncbi:hypothetical protein MesoLjLc_02380 [Mesorhizobium sp. L-8-10]|nr:hypothetical protein MesoLjLb_02390 [Mesorhizobium sp. L-8-3]BCH28308.1 hypothetical protein MesoLjLc_02380 [Mesorhizobium sp. L-8-10]